MVKIPRNRQDSEMVGNLKEEVTFEHLTDGNDEKPAAKPVKKEPALPAYATFLTPELAEDLGKALLALKVNLYKDGTVDYTIKVACEGTQVVLKAVPVNKPAKQR